MCFIIDEKHPDKKIATKSIMCYKVLKMVDNKLRSPYQNFSYKLGRKYTSRLGKECGYINKGLHSFSSKEAALYERDDWYASKYIIFICKIPKGSEYYYNPTNQEYVSNQLIITKQL